ncbi:MAG: hypothetical protein JNM68_05045 [Dinghuibacter sp.]|nr:hypothetical protein [Dinghuibacter sp.]
MHTKVPYPASEKIRNFMSVVVGVLLFFALLLLSFPLFNEAYRYFSAANNSPASGSLLSLVYLGVLLLNTLLCGMLAAWISTRKARAHAFITGLVLLALYLLFALNAVNWAAVSGSAKQLVLNLLVPVILLLGPFAGGLLFMQLFRTSKKVK